MHRISKIILAAAVALAADTLRAADIAPGPPAATLAAVTATLFTGVILLAFLLLTGGDWRPRT
jgi:hypothetical protein